MIILFTDNTYHAGASTTSSNDKSVRFFSYVYKTSEVRGYMSPKPIGNEVESVHMKTCANKEVSNEHGACNNSICKSCEGEKDGRILDFTSVNLADYNVGDVIGGSIAKHGWAVVKGTKLGEEDKFKSIVVDCGEKRKRIRNTLGSKTWTNGLDVGTPLSVGGSRNRKKIVDYRACPKWVQNHETIMNLNDYMKSICDDVISRVIGRDYITEFSNILYNNSNVTPLLINPNYYKIE